MSAEAPGSMEAVIRSIVREELALALAPFLAPHAAAEVPVSEPEWLTLREVAARLRVTVITVRARIKSGYLKAHRSQGARDLVVRLSDLRAFMNGSGNRPAARRTPSVEDEADRLRDEFLGRK